MVHNHQEPKLKEVKKGILFIAMAFLITAGLSAQDQLRTQLKTQDKDHIQDPDKDQLKTKDQIRFHQGVSAKSAKPAGGAMKNAGANGGRKAQGASGAGTTAKTAKRSGMGPKR